MYSLQEWVFSASWGLSVIVHSPWLPPGAGCCWRHSGINVACRVPSKARREAQRGPISILRTTKRGWKCLGHCWPPSTLPYSIFTTVPTPSNVFSPHYFLLTVYLSLYKDQGVLFTFIRPQNSGWQRADTNISWNEWINADSALPLPTTYDSTKHIWAYSQNLL